MADGSTRLQWKAPWMNEPPEAAEARWRPSRRARQLALGVWIERQVEAGRVRSYAEMARRLGVSRGPGDAADGPGVSGGGGEGGAVGARVPKPG